MVSTFANSSGKQNRGNLDFCRAIAKTVKFKKVKEELGFSFAQTMLNNLVYNIILD